MLCNGRFPCVPLVACIPVFFNSCLQAPLCFPDIHLTTLAEEEHLTTTFRQNGYPLPFIRTISSSIQKPSATPEEEPDEEPDDEESQKEEEKQPLAIIPYVSGVSERIRKACEKYNLKVVFKSGPTLHSLLTRVKDPLPKEKLAGVVYQIACQCGKVYVGETQRRLETRVKEHRDACN